jgi:peptidyl-prolyl cis-trans isomerase B (cyclophilin B)
MKSLFKTHPGFFEATPPETGGGGSVSWQPCALMGAVKVTVAQVILCSKLTTLPPPVSGGVARLGPGWVLLGLLFALFASPALAAPKGHPIVEMMTSKGLILIKLYPEDAPKSAANFIKLVNMHFYDGTKIHRVADLEGEPGSGTGHIVQGGSPISRAAAATDPNVGSGGPGWQIKGEFPSNGVNNPLLHNQGAFAMARTDSPDSAGSQFYIVVTPAHSLDGKYAVFGQVIQGLDIANQLVVGSTITKVTIVQSRY